MQNQWKKDSKDNNDDNLVPIDTSECSLQSHANAESSEAKINFVQQKKYVPVKAASIQVPLDKCSLIFLA